MGCHTLTMPKCGVCTHGSGIKQKKLSFFCRKVWGKSALKEICASLVPVMSLAGEEARQSIKVSTVLHLPSEHSSTETHQCWRSTHFVVKKDDEATTTLEVLGQKGT